MIHTREEVKCVKRGNGMKIIKVKSCVDCPHRALGVHCEETGRETSLPGPPDWCPLEDAPDATELWVVAQLLPDEGIEDGVKRIEELLGEQ